jgi:methionyl-tRNA formyltransferase
MLAFARTAIGPEETAGELEDRLAALGAPLVAQSIAELAQGTARIIPQERAKVTKAPKLRKEDGLIDWTLPAQAIHNLVRAMQPWPLASTTWTSRDSTSKGPLRLILHKTQPVETHTHTAPGTVLEAQAHQLVVAAGDGALRIDLLQVPGKKPMPAAEFLRGHRVRPGDVMEREKQDRPDQ